MTIAGWVYGQLAEGAKNCHHLLYASGWFT